jgi:hypothetical protein
MVGIVAALTATPRVAATTVRVQRVGIYSARPVRDALVEALHERGWVEGTNIASTRDAEGAEGDFRESLALAARVGMRPLVAHCHLGLGKLS